MRSMNRKSAHELPQWRHGERNTARVATFRRVLVVAVVCLVGTAGLSTWLLMSSLRAYYTAPATSSTVPYIHTAAPRAISDATDGLQLSERDTSVDTRSVELSARRRGIQGAMQFVWSMYRDRAFGADEIAPVTGRARNNWGSTGCMILDSLDTLWIMGMRTEFDEARNWVARSLRLDKMGTISVFETIIRGLGGLLSAFDLSRDPLFLDKAVELAQRMLPAISTTTGRASYLLDTNTNETKQPGTLAESGTYQLEFEYLSAVTGDSTYSTRARRFYTHLQAQDYLQLHGLFANEIGGDDAGPESVQAPFSISMGARGDSFYEYLLKVWLLRSALDGTSTNGADNQKESTKHMYMDAVDGMQEFLLHKADHGPLYVADYDLTKKRVYHRMQHLTCFVPGMLALGSVHLSKQGDEVRSRQHLELARELMKTCYHEFYARQPTGLSPECVQDKSLRPCVKARRYKLRPEVVESLYVLNHVTGDAIYQDWGWAIFQAIEKHCRVDYGYAVYRDVTVVRDGDTAEGLHDDRMHTFFTAETLKYLYLLMDPDNGSVNLDTHVFNTEAHPLSMGTLSELLNA